MLVAVTDGSKVLEKLQIKKVNYIAKVVRSEKILRPNVIDTMDVLPREPPKALKGLSRVGTPWDFLNSVFAKYKPDTEKLLNDCFHFDWDRMRIDKIFKSDEAAIAECKEFLR